MTPLIAPLPVSTTTNMKVIILQGVPGSGKSFYANEFVAHANVKSVICSADDYFYELGGGTKYAFDASKLGQAHGACFRRFIGAVRSEVPVVVVDNTNTTVSEISPYVLGGEAYGYEVEVVQVLCDPAVAAARNTHGVPEKAIQAMAARIASCSCPPWWKVTTVQAG